MSMRKGKLKVDDDVLPDFLEDSPFLPVWNNYEPKKAVRPKRVNITQVLKSKPARLAYGVVFFLFILMKLRAAHVYERITGPSCYFRNPVAPDPDPYWRTADVDWSQFAYSLYATDVEYLCSAVVVFASLQQYNSRADRLLLYADTMSLDENSEEGKLLLRARDDLGVKLQPVKVLHEKKAAYSGPNWADSYTKLLAFNQTQYSRVIVMDSDSLLLDSLDDLFFIPPAAAVMPRAYWLRTPTLASHIMVLTPSAESSGAVSRAIAGKANYGFYDMEIMNYVFGRTCQVLPHRPYALLTGEFRRTDHAAYLGRGLPGNERAARAWNPETAMGAAKLVHFSDHPLPKPWLATEEQVAKAKPDCDFNAEPGKECAGQKMWLNLYSTFREKKLKTCGL